MKNLFRADQVSIASGMDLVRIKFRSETFILYYPTVFKICSSMGGAARFAMRHEGQRPNLWAELAAYDRADAATIQVWMRRAAKEAKNWSGDTSRIWNTYARLCDVEENDKVVYAL